MRARIWANFYSDCGPTDPTTLNGNPAVVPGMTTTVKVYANKCAVVPVPIPSATSTTATSNTSNTGKGTPTPGSQIKYEDHRPRNGDDATKHKLWVDLDASINGPDYGDGRTAPWFKFPTVTQHRPEVNYIQLMRKLWSQSRQSSGEADLMDGHISAVHCMAGASPYPPNVLQGEFVFVADFLAHLFPMMVRAATESDLVRMQEMVNVGNDFLRSMQILVDVEANARTKINNTLLK